MGNAFVTFFDFLSNNYRLLRFMFTLSKAFKLRKPEAVLLVINEFFKSEFKYYGDKYVLGRRAETSSEVLGNLIKSYLKTKSGTTLNQILEVFKHEFMERKV